MPLSIQVSGFSRPVGDLRTHDPCSQMTIGPQSAPAGRGAPLEGVGLASLHERNPGVCLHTPPWDVEGTSFMEGQGLGLCHFLPTSQQTSRLNQAHNGGNGSSQRSGSAPIHAHLAERRGGVHTCPTATQVLRSVGLLPTLRVGSQQGSSRLACSSQ